MLILHGCTSSHTLSPLIVVYTTCTRQPSSGSPTRASATAYLNTQVSSPGLSPIQVPSAGSPAEVSTYGPGRCVQGSETPNGCPACPATMYLPHHSPPLGSALRTASNTYPTNTRTYLQLLDRGQGRLISRAGSYFRAQRVVVAVHE